MVIKDEYVEKIVDCIDKHDPIGSVQIAKKIDISLSIVRRILLELEKLGIVGREGYRRGTKWWLV